MSSVHEQHVTSDATPRTRASLTAQPLARDPHAKPLPQDLAPTLCWRGSAALHNQAEDTHLMHDQVLDLLSTAHLLVPLGPTGLAAYCSSSKGPAGLPCCLGVTGARLTGSSAWTPPGAASCRSYLADSSAPASTSAAHHISCMIRSWTCSSSSFAATGAAAAAAANGAAAGAGSGLGAGASLLGAAGTGKLMSLEMSLAMLLARAARRCLVSLRHRCACVADAWFKAAKQDPGPRAQVLTAAAWQPCSM